MTKKDIQAALPLAIFLITLMVVTPSAFIFNNLVNKVSKNRQDITDLSEELFQDYLTRDEAVRIEESISKLENRIYEQLAR